MSVFLLILPSIVLFWVAADTAWLSDSKASHRRASLSQRKVPWKGDKQTAESSVYQGKEFRKSAPLAKQDDANPLSDHTDRNKKIPAAEAETLLSAAIQSNFR